VNAAALGFQGLRGLFALLMLSTSVTKLLDMPGFYAIVDSYRVLPAALIAPSAWALVITELLLFAWLLWGRQLRWVGLVLIAMHTVYLVWISVALARGLELDNCGCFGVYFARPLRWYTPLEDLVLIAMAVAFWALARRRERA
jgi:hypothetical protein